MPLLEEKTGIKLVKLSIRSVKVMDAKPVDFMTKNDLFCLIEAGTIRYRTPTLDNIGPNGDWDLGHAGDNASGLFQLEEARKIKMNFELWDENMARSNTKIGVSDPIDMSKLVDCVNDVRTFAFNVHDTHRNVTGKVQIMAVLIPHYSHTSMQLSY